MFHPQDTINTVQLFCDSYPEIKQIQAVSSIESFAGFTAFELYTDDDETVKLFIWTIPNPDNYYVLALQYKPNMFSSEIRVTKTLYDTMPKSWEIAEFVNHSMVPLMQNDASKVYIESISENNENNCLDLDSLNLDSCF